MSQVERGSQIRQNKVFYLKVARFAGAEEVSRFLDTKKSDGYESKGEAKQDL